MVFKTLTIQNFMSIRSITLNLQDRGLVLIKGKNMDSPDLNNNGSGKSSMIEALVYALYGRTIRGVKGDSVVHKIPGKNMKIFLDLEDDDGTSYRIARYRKHSVNKNKSLLYRNGKDITPKSESDFNDYVANLLQADYLTFTSSLLYSAESFKFTSATDAEMKNTFDVMLGLDVFQKCLEITKFKLKEVESDLSSTQWKIDDRESKIDILDSKIEEAEVNKSKFESSINDKRISLENSLSSMEVELDSLIKELPDIEDSLSKSSDKKASLQKKLSSKKKRIEELEELKSELNDIKSEIKDNESSIKRSEKSIARYKMHLDDYKVQIEVCEDKIERFTQNKHKLDTTIGSPCPTCGQSITPDSIEPAKQELDEKIEKYQNKIVQYNLDIKSDSDSIESEMKSIDEFNESIEELNKTAAEFEELIRKSSNISKEKLEIEEAIENAQEEYYKIQYELKVKNSEIEQLKNKMEQVAEDIESLDDIENPYDGMIEKYNSEKAEYCFEITELKASIQDKVDEKECLLFWQQAYSNKGIKSLILDDITPFLNRRVNKYLGKLTSGHIEVKFSTQTILKSGDIREKFSIDISNQDGGGEYIANSGGEKKRIDLAINLALQDLVASRSSKRINIAIWDEVFDALDSTGIEKVVELLQELSEEKSTILVVSHNAHLQSYFNNVITVVKKNGYSELLNRDVEDVEEIQE